MKTEGKKIRLRDIIRQFWIGVIIFFLLVSVLDGFYTIDGGERGVLLTFGKPTLASMEAGLHFKVPFAQEVVKFDVKTAKYEADASAASKDLQIVSTKIAVNYHLMPDVVAKMYQEVGMGYQERIIQPAVQEAVKASTAKFTAEELIQKRLEVKQEIDNLLQERLANKNIILETTSITNFDFSPEFNRAIESKQVAVQEALKAQNDLQRIEVEKKQKITQAEATSESQKKLADAEAYTKEVNGKAEASARLAVAQAEAESLRLKKAQLSNELVKLRTIEQWNGVLPQYMISEAVPLLEIK